MTQTLHDGKQRNKEGVSFVESTTQGRIGVT